jgi:hypothetical protein
MKRCSVPRSATASRIRRAGSRPPVQHSGKPPFVSHAAERTGAWLTEGSGVPAEGNYRSRGDTLSPIRGLRREFAFAHTVEKMDELRGAQSSIEQTTSRPCSTAMCALSPSRSTKAERMGRSTKS